MNLSRGTLQRCLIQRCTRRRFTSRKDACLRRSGERNSATQADCRILILSQDQDQSGDPVESSV